VGILRFNSPPGTLARGRGRMRGATLEQVKELGRVLEDLDGRLGK
jgi:hypothetical protein